MSGSFGVGRLARSVATATVVILLGSVAAGEVHVASSSPAPGASLLSVAVTLAAQRGGVGGHRGAF
jgi:phage gp46-like protein